MLRRWRPRVSHKIRPLFLLLLFGRDLEALTDADRAKLQAWYEGLQHRFPKSGACRRIPLDFLRGAAFESAARAFAADFVRKGIPSLFTALRPLYRDAAKGAFLGRMFEEWAAGRGESRESLGPEAETWIEMFLSQHLDRLGRCAESSVRLRDDRGGRPRDDTDSTIHACHMSCPGPRVPRGVWGGADRIQIFSPRAPAGLPPLVLFPLALATAIPVSLTTRACMSQARGRAGCDRQGRGSIPGRYRSARGSGKGPQAPRRL